MSITLQQLRYFVALADTGQVSRAAERCNISQPSMTTSLRNLEAIVGVPLILRGGGGLRLTRQGERFAMHARGILSGVSDAVRDARLPEPVEGGTLSVGVTETVSGYFVPALLTELRQRLPQLNVRLEERQRGEVLADLRDGRLDLAIVLVSNVAASDGVVCETFERYRRTLWTSMDHPLARRNKVSLHDVAREPFVLLDMDEHVETVERYWGGHGISPSVLVQSRSIEAVRSLVADGAGVTILSDLVFRGWSHSGRRIRRTEIVEDVPTMDIGVALAEGRAVEPRAAEFLSFLRSWARRPRAMV